MDELKPSAWDRLPVEGAYFRTQEDLGGMTVVPALCRLRVEMFEAAAESAAGGGTSAAGTGWRELGTEYLVRCAYWRGRQEATKAGCSGRFFVMLGLLLVGVLFLLIVPLIGAVFLLMVVTFGLFVAAMPKLIVFPSDHRAAAVWLAHEKKRCPDCGYDLFGAPPGLAIELMHGSDAGPRACPECGVAWPMLPLPLPRIQ